MPHIHTRDGEFDFTVAGFIVYQDTTLLIKHKYLPLWTPPAGHIELDQTPLDALYNEIREESGITREHLTLIETEKHNVTERPAENRALPLPFDFEIHPIQNGHRHINMSYVLISDTNHVEPGPGESNTFKWFTIDELRNFSQTNSNIIASAQFAIETAAEKGSQ